MPNLQDRAMLVDLTIKAWGATKHDKRATAEVAANHGATGDAGRYNKRLVSRDALANIGRIAMAMRAEHLDRTLAWTDRGERILSNVGFFDYDAIFRQHKSAWDSALAIFLAGYDDLVRDAQVSLGTLYNASDYPSRGAIAQKFSMSYLVFPIPDKSDFRVNLDASQVQMIRDQIESHTNAALDGAIADLVARIQEVVSSVSAKLRAYDPSGPKVDGIFRDSLIGNVKDLVALIPSLNINQSPKIAAIADAMSADLCRFTACDLRTDKTARNTTANAADAILSKLSGII